MCNCKKRPAPISLPGGPPLPGENGFVHLQYIGADAKTEYGPITGARYPFWEKPVRLVDKRDAERMLETGVFAVVTNE